MIYNLSSFIYIFIIHFISCAEKGSFYTLSFAHQAEKESLEAWDEKIRVKWKREMFQEFKESQRCPQIFLRNLQQVDFVVNGATRDLWNVWNVAKTNGDFCKKRCQSLPSINNRQTYILIFISIRWHLP